MDSSFAVTMLFFVLGMYIAGAVAYNFEKNYYLVLIAQSIAAFFLMAVFWYLGRF
ncbi:hypothetical protein ACFL6S_18430 [Candidatus Poribacteria bacterium]